MAISTTTTKVRLALSRRWQRLLVKIGYRPPRGRYREVYCIDIWTGDSPTNLRPTSTAPAYTRNAARRDHSFYPADPFLIRREGLWYLFYEQLRWTDEKGVIAVASSKDLRKWRYLGEVLDEPGHLSYPHLIEHAGQLFMLPESGAAGNLTLYHCTEFPLHWTPKTELLKGEYADSTLIFHEQNWYLFTCSKVETHDELSLFTSPDLFGPYSEHPSSPLITDDNTAARPAGKILDMGDHLLRFAQVCEPMYGSGVRGFRIDNLSPTSYSEIALDQPVLSGSGKGWNSHGMHHLDAHRLDDGSWVAAVDGWQPISK